jgi:hypothetical protein
MWFLDRHMLILEPPQEQGNKERNIYWVWANLVVHAPPRFRR